MDADADIVRRPTSRILHFVAACRGCPFSTKSPLQARIHAAEEEHHLAITKRYILEPH